MRKIFVGLTLSLISMMMITMLIVVAGGSITTTDTIIMAVFSIAANTVALKKGWIQALILDVERENAQVRKQRLGK